MRILQVMNQLIAFAIMVRAAPVPSEFDMFRYFLPRRLKTLIIAEITKPEECERVLHYSIGPISNLRRDSC